MVDFMNKTGNIKKHTDRILKAISEGYQVEIADFRMLMLLKSYEAMEVYYNHAWKTGERCSILKKIATDFYKHSKLPEKEIYSLTKSLWKTKSETLF